jgi:hypothetical protein
MNDSSSDQVASLQAQVAVLKLALIVVAGTLVAYLYYQQHILGKDVAAVRPQAMPVIQAFQQNYATAEAFKAQLANYALTHQDFQPILRKYGWAPPAAPTNPAPAKK